MGVKDGILTGVAEVKEGGVEALHISADKIPHTHLNEGIEYFTIAAQMIIYLFIVLLVGGHQREIDLAETTDRPVILGTKENLLVVHQNALVAGV